MEKKKILLVCNKQLLIKSLGTSLTKAEITFESASKHTDISNKLKTGEYGCVILCAMVKADTPTTPETDIAALKVMPRVMKIGKETTPISMIWYGAEEDRVDFDFNRNTECFATTTFFPMTSGHDQLIEVLKQILAGEPGNIVNIEPPKTEEARPATNKKAQAERPEPAAPSEVVQEDQGGLKFLIVDPAENIQVVIRAILKELGFNEIQRAVNAEEALEKLQSAPKTSRKFDLIISEWQLPKMDGLELLRKVRSDSVYASTPFIIATALDAKENVIKAVQEKVSQYVVKPFSKETFRQKLLQVLPKQNKNTPNSNSNRRAAS